MTLGTYLVMMQCNLAGASHLQNNENNQVMSKQSFPIENHFYTFTMKFGPDPKFDVIDDVIMITSTHQVRCQDAFDRGRPLPCH